MWNRLCFLQMPTIISYVHAQSRRPRRIVLTCTKKREEEQGWMEELFRSWGVTNAATQEMVARRYIERMVGCITNVTSSKCTLSGKEQRAEIRKMLHNPRVDKALALAKPRSGYMKVMLLPIRWKNVTLAWMESSVITFVKEHNGKLFARMKAGR